MTDAVLVPPILQDRPLGALLAGAEGRERAFLVKPCGTGRPSGFLVLDRALLVGELFLPVTAAMETFRDGYAVPYLCLPTVYDRLYGVAVRRNLEPHRAALAGLPEGGPDGFVLGGSTNHCHWVFDFLPRLWFLSMAPAFWDAPLVVHGDITDDQRAAVALAAGGLGLPAPRLRPMTETVLALRGAAYPFAVGREAAVAAWRRILAGLGIAHRPSRRLFVGRGGASRRRLVNEADIVARLAVDGFEQVDPGALDFERQVRLFSEAEAIVAPHGAALSGLVFAAPGIAVVELRSERHIALYADMAAAAGQRYAAVPARTLDGAEDDPLHRDIACEPEAVAAAVAAMLHGRSSP